ncbi:MAG: hypothetical protein HXY34_03290 [Candidatus Thorarchaeota archaeon]|nr:hypothetical protein [Candidatus Thorarchaeota archaeon]
MNIEGVVIFEAKSGIPLFSKVRGGMDASMFSSFVAAARHFSSELQLGGLSSFSTDEKVIFLASTARTVTALITPKSPEFQETYEFALELGQAFESKYEIPERPQPEEYDGFKSTVDEMLKKVREPFLNRVAEFAHKEYGGEVSIRARLMTKSGSEGVIDVMVNHSERIEDDGRHRQEESATTMLSRNLIFIRAIDDMASKGAVIDFIDAVDSYGAMIVKRDRLEFTPYYPKKAVVVARDYASDVSEFISRLPKEENRPYIDDGHVVLGIKTLAARQTRCFVELWIWRDNAYPEKIVG